MYSLLKDAENFNTKLSKLDGAADVAAHIVRVVREKTALTEASEATEASEPAKATEPSKSSDDGRQEQPQEVSASEIAGRP